jgi:hypothetical protein
MIMELELWMTDGVSVSLVSINVWRLQVDTLKITCNFRYCNHQVYRDSLITLYKSILAWSPPPRLSAVKFSTPVVCKLCFEKPWDCTVDFNISHKHICFILILVNTILIIFFHFPLHLCAQSAPGLFPVRTTNHNIIYYTLLKRFLV